ncbi:peptidase domain-containing ABC transporter [Variovorax sp. PCZ-1]|uniref:peptidase domain-containing ABC transporter n=1 Tax=Variovorax sp. PCZ-1 TaxID=2835533 RepID=UPI0020BEB411|nr:peptidase domain-containing ABC transporter [Variovorax sp. PCZ-1]
MSWTSAISLSGRAKLPLLLQSEGAECGLACLGMVLGYHGVMTDVSTLRRRYSLSLKGMNLATLAELAAQEKLGQRAVRLELEELNQLRLPAILHWELNHFVVLKAVQGQRVVVLDPAVGERSLSMAEVSKAFTGVALELWPNPGFAPREEKTPITLRGLIGQVRGLLPALTNILLLSLALEIFALVSPLFLQWITDHVLVSRDTDLLATLAFGFLIVLALQQLIGLLRAWLLLGINTSIRVQWHSNVMAHLLRLPIAYFQKRHLGDIISRSQAIDDIQRTLTATFVEAVFDGLLVLLSLLLMFIYSPLLTAVALLGVILYALLRWLLYAPMYAATEEQILRSANLSTHTLESIRGIRALKLFGRQAQRHGAWQSLLVAQTNANLQLQRLSIVMRLVANTLAGLSILAILWLGAQQVLANALSIGMLLAFLAYRGQFEQRMQDLIGKAIDFKMLRLYAQRLGDIALTPAEPTQTTLEREPTGLSGDLVLQGLRFRYADQEPWVLDGLNLRITAGESVAIVGESGCGKTTLVHLLLGALQPSDGQLSLGGKSLEQIGLDRWRKQVGTVMQDDTLFMGSLADNICFFDAQPDAERIEHCAHLAAVAEDIEAMPMGYQTLVGDMGTVLSGGQKQRVLLARALYKQPQFLILDEATSHLDVRREAQVNANLVQMQITRIVVAHRPQTIAAMQRVVAIDAGQVVFDGPSAAYLAQLQNP